MRVESLTFFRFVAALIVVFFHFGGHIGLPLGLLAGQQMVTFFFVLSGLVMALAYFHRDPIDLRAYWWARFARIFPVYFVALLMMVAIAWVWRDDFDPLAVTLNLLFLQAWIPPYPLSLNTPGWSLSVEMFLYLVFPLALLLIRRYRLSVLPVFLIAAGLWLLTQALLMTALNLGWYDGYPSTSHDLIVYFPLVHLPSFLLGMAGGIWLISSPQRQLSGLITLPLVLLSAALVIYLLQQGLWLQAWLGLKLPFESSFMAPFFLLFIVALSLCRGPLAKLFSLPPLVLLGEASYSLYILQIPMYNVYSAATMRLVDADPLLKFIGLVVFLIVTSILSYLYFEKPANRYLRYHFPHHIRGRRVPAMAAPGKEE